MGYAAAGRFAEAVKTAQQALALFASQNNTASADALRAGSSSTRPILLIVKAEEPKRLPGPSEKGQK